MITVHRNGTNTTFRHYRIQDIARLLEHFLQVIFVEGKFTNKLGVFASSISLKLPFRTRTHTHTQRRHVDTCSNAFCLTANWCKLWIKYTQYCMCGQCWSLLINQIYNSICLKLKHNKISTDFMRFQISVLYISSCWDFKNRVNILIDYSVVN